MKRRIGLISILFFLSHSVSSKEIYSCGRNTGAPFNGWSVEPYSAFTSIEFTEESISFYAEKGGDYSVVLIRKIETMPVFHDLNLSIGFDNFQNCTLLGVDLFVSADGKNWESVFMNQKDFSGSWINENRHQFVKIVSHVSCRKYAYFECTYFKLSSESELITETVEEVVNSENEEEFFIFFFNRSVNVETKNERPYEVVFTNLSGQQVYKETVVGSTRIETDLPQGIYIVSIIQDQSIQRSKKLSFTE